MVTSEKVENGGSLGKARTTPMNGEKKVRRRMIVNITYDLASPQIVSYQEYLYFALSKLVTLATRCRSLNPDGKISWYPAEVPSYRITYS